MSRPADTCLPPSGQRISVRPGWDFLFSQPDGRAIVLQSLPNHGPRYEVTLPSTPLNILIVTLRSDAMPYEGRLAGQRCRFVSRPGQHMLLPALADSEWEAEMKAHESLAFGFPAEWLAEAAAAHDLPGHAAALAPRIAGRDPVLARLAGHARTLRDEGAGSPEAYEHIAVMGALRLLGGHTPVQAAVGSLAAHRLRRVLEHIEAHLEEPLRLSDLAATAGLSVFHFARAFRQSMGVAPHAHIRARRVARAQEMMRAGRGALADIALACGFADQSHFTTAFRKATGTTPRRWRAAAH